MTSRPIITLLAGVVSALGVSPSEAQAPDPVSGSQLTVYLVTVGPGDKMWERFGHNAIWIHDEDAGTDIAYNYGLFSFEQENFLIRFIQGRMRYWMAAFDAERHLQHYTERNRSVWVQELDLTPSERTRLADFLRWNALPENAYYDYDYYLDNCSTRIRDALNEVLDGQIRQQTEQVEAGGTLRFHTQRLTASAPLLYTGTLLGLGNPVDRAITVWDEMFLPMKVRDRLGTMMVRGPGGNERPLVKSERVWYASTAPPSPAQPPAFLVWYLLIGLVLAAALLYTGSGALERRGRRVGFAVVAIAWLTLAGAAGVALTGLWTLTDHTAAYWNENLFLFNPIAVPLALLVPFVVQGRAWSLRPAIWLAIAVGMLAILGFALQALPGFDQVNGQLYALALPANIAAAIAIGRMARAK